MITSDGVDPQKILQVAVAHHNAGQLREALVLYQQLLQRFPEHRQVLAVVGQIELQLGRPADAVSYLSRAVVAAADCSQWQPQWLLDLGAGLHMLGREEEAVRCFTLVIDNGHSSVDAYYNRGTVLLQMNHLDAAIADFDRALALDGAQPRVLVNRAVALSSLGCLEAAAQSYARAAVCAPDNAEIHYLLGNAMLAVSRLPEALAAYARTFDITPGHSEAANNYGIVLRRLGRSNEALPAFKVAIAANPHNASAHVNYGTALMELGQAEEALAAFDAALALNPELAELFNHRGTALKMLGRLSEAQASYARAIALKPDFAEAHANCALVALGQDRPQAALAELDEAIRLDPSCAQYHTNRGLALQAMNMTTAALESFTHACLQEPRNPEYQWNLALQELSAGHFRDGWARYECRWKRAAFARDNRDFPGPQWTGTADITGRRLLIHAEQGLGDTVQFCRYVPKLVAMGAIVIFEAPGPLLPLLQSLNRNIRFVRKGDALPAIDLHCPLMSLPHLLGPELTDVPPAPYLAADPARVAYWHGVLGEKVRPRIGLAVSGRVDHANDRNRSIALKLFSGLLTLPFDFHLLQCEVRTDDEAVLAATPSLQDHRASLTNFGETAALISALDGVIAVDSVVAHVAGAVGAPLSLLLPFAADWRWMTQVGHSPWYASAHLYRQSQIGNWNDVLAALSDDLRNSF